MNDTIEPFIIDIAQDALDDLQERLRRTRWPQEIGDNGQWQAGTNLGFMRELTDYWINHYDWRAQETAMNAFPQFRTTIDDVPVHFIHVKGKAIDQGPRPMPLIINHGWPWTFWDMRKIIGPLTDPAAHGGDPADAFEVIAPSLPGFGFSSPLERPGIYFTPTADLWAKLMTRLGHERFATQGGDIGAFVSAMLGHKYADRVIGAHLHLLAALKAPYPAPEDYAPEEAGWRAKHAAFFAEGSAYMQIQRTRPQTISFAMNDSPVGLAAWLIDKRRAWSDCGGDVESVFSKDDLITTVMIYWLTETYESSARHYYEGRPENFVPAFVHDRVPVVEAPTGILQFEGDIWLQPRKWAERYYNLKRWNVVEKGGHFAPMEAPDILVDDLRAFFRPLRG
ncbi:epoxide hydrolase family protein [Sphingomonas psychrolutea]|uniref:Multidrug MFS transporter n=1 Tax=Sphingomonas psychrolutea TaxID=1259676 RepID=A0ABQ1G653_9SPHN|nr:epoxide hydrolase family protein [Sphingomonas psychrolutea]GGA37525.1 multidrug MFS transporter [Sphingomonas psychrolutea]